MTLGSKARSWELNRRQQANGQPLRNVPDDEPAPTLTATAGAKSQWVWERPATTVVASFRPDIIGAPCHHGEVSRLGDPKSVRISLREALVLQSFPPDYPVQGSRSKAFEQIGNAVPPRLAAHVLARLIPSDLDLVA